MDHPSADLRRLPSVHALVEHVVETGGAAGVSRGLVVEAARSVLEERRGALATVGAGAEPLTLDALAVLVVQQIDRGQRPLLPPIINGTGIIIHTGLGRAPLAAAAARAVEAAGRGYAPVEIDLASGARGNRTVVVRDLLCSLTGAESATVVNNTAAALMIVLSTVAKGKPVVISRGELIEIGGSFRLPDVCAAGGAVLREVGTTNRTRLGDYERAIDETTAAVMKVHTSNYQMAGFTASVSIEELASLGRHHGVTVIDDIGSGALRPTADYGWPSAEPHARGSIEAGADLVLFSGDKLLGGPQAGIIVGRRALIDAIEKNPMMRAMRVDKLTLAALGATLQLHRDPAEAMRAIPVWRCINEDEASLTARGERIAAEVRTVGAGGASNALRVEVTASSAYLGGGSLPTQAVPSVAVVVYGASIGETDLAARLRMGRPAVLPRVKDGAVWFDLRTVHPEQDDDLVAAVCAALS